MTTATPLSEQSTAKSGRGIGPIGTAARVVVGLGLLYLNQSQGETRRDFAVNHVGPTLALV